MDNHIRLRKAFTLLCLLCAVMAKAVTSFSEGKQYLISMKSNSALYIGEGSDGYLSVMSFATNACVFWEFIPTGNTNCYYIRNAATGHYIASCKGTQSASSRITTTDTPVEYYVGVNGTNIRMTSTDCDNYANTASSPNGLNKDGASSNVIIWKAGASNGNSWWTATETSARYEVQPFTPSSAVGTPVQKYYMKNLSGKHLELSSDKSLAWTTESGTSAQWYFVGTSNSAGGYQLVNAASHEVLSDGARYYIYKGTVNYYFASAQSGAALEAAGDSLIAFEAVRSPYALAAGVYQMPCATLADKYISALSLTGAAAATPLTYPIQVKSGSTLKAESTKPSDAYSIYTKSKATLMQGLDATLDITLSAAPAEGDEIYAYFDWNRDGLFETTYPLTAAKEISQTIAVPADAATGKSRMRIRLTSTGDAGAEDDAIGQTVDFILHVQAPAAFTATVAVNDSTRGTAVLDGTTAHATAKGNATFVCWKEGNSVVSLSEDYTFELDHNVSLTAIFSPNTQTTDGIHIMQGGSSSALLQISAQNRRITVKSTSDVRRISVYSPSGALVAEGHAATLDVSSLNAGTYIVKVQTAQADKSIKTFLE